MKVPNKYLSTEVNGNGKEKQNQWFDEIDVALEEEKASGHSSKWIWKSSGHSKKSSSASKLSSNNSSKERTAVERTKPTELMMEAEFLEKK